MAALTSAKMKEMATQEKAGPTRAGIKFERHFAPAPETGRSPYDIGGGNAQRDHWQR